MINTIIGLVVIFVMIYLLGEMANTVTSFKTKFMVSLAFILGLGNIIGDLAL
jgi:hypothetical protein